MSQIVRDGGFYNLLFGVVDSDGVDVITLAGFFSDLTIFNATLFFESAVIVFNRSADSLEIS